jgi:dehydrogenase/reductase SDR family protein 7B
MSVHKKVIWITGASSGIGAALAIELSKRDCQLILSSRNEAGLVQTKSQCFGSKENIKIIPFDLGRIDKIVDIHNLAKQFFGSIDILINNAGISQRSLTIDTDLDVYTKIMNINFFGTVALTKAVLPEMIQRGSGQIVTITSLVGKFGTPLRSGYAASKHALHGFFDSLRSEVYTQGVEIILICPGFIQTDISIRALVGNGNHHGSMDLAQEKGMNPTVFSQKMIAAMEANKEEVCIGGIETLCVLVKRIFPSFFSMMIRNVDMTS